ncbi:uncharacterized protein LOC105188671 [Harpegnathos saltator]|uniref:uncharacterized protein LOC105188671 n=1 Tax=Harpegnathos saltator TaxID=610380 RepID=UPI00058CBE45|nr:uncharacterized protein LOC105188671 [Harpegnathos saltator]
MSELFRSRRISSISFDKKNYNKWFYSNVCHVCKKENNNDLISCAECDMISYCSDEHKQLHNEKHREICGYLKEYIKSHMGNETGVDHVTWINSRLQFLNSIKKRLSRKLEPYEEQMILFAKSCFSCHQQIHLENCRRCYSINYCVVHAQEFKIQHESRCNELLFGPLTLFYAMRDANLLHFLNISPPKCIIHIVVSTYHDIEYLAAWELLSHLLCPAIKILKIVLIGQELTQKVGSILLCCNCINKELKVKYEFCPKLYCDYMKCQTYEQPSVVVGFQVDFRDKKMLSNFLPLFQIKSYPLLLTTASKNKAIMNINEINAALGTNVKPTYEEENKFRSYKPLRDLEDGLGCFCNMYVSIYLNLEDVPASSKAI